jgi:hypothetical protein
MVLKDMSKLKNPLMSIWYHSEPSDVSYSPNQILGWEFFASSYSKTALMVFICHAQRMLLYDPKISNGPSLKFCQNLSKINGMEEKIILMSG